ncbi:hypothetical protein HYS54_02440 [Candidatus Micrarchaeota archaeon]|nr:hypothetical protein [Candidatus Micrarchaeota archaeon]
MKGNKTASKHKTLGARESRLIMTLLRLEKSVFGVSDANEILNANGSSVRKILFSLNRKGWIRRLSQGTYELVGEWIKKQEIAAIAARQVWPSYLSLWSALNRYGLTEQAPQTLFFVTSARGRKLLMNNVECIFCHVSKDRFFGYVREDSLDLAEKEKAIVDSLYLVGRVPFDEIEKTFLSGENLDVDKLVEYARRMHSKSLVKRLGYLLDRAKLLNGKNERSLLKDIGIGYSLLDPGGPKTGRFDTKWLLIINR